MKLNCDDFYALKPFAPQYDLGNEGIFQKPEFPIKWRMDEALSEGEVKISYHEDPVIIQIDYIHVDRDGERMEVTRLQDGDVPLSVIWFDMDERIWCCEARQLYPM